MHGYTRMIRRFLSRLFRDDQGQDLTEYTLLIAMVALVAFAIFASTGTTAAGVWSGAGATLDGANTTATGASSATAPADPPPHHHDHD